MDNPKSSPLRVLEAKPRVSGSRVGAVVSIGRSPIVDFAGNPLGPQPARVLASLSSTALSTAYEANLPVLIVFEDDDASRPVIIDVVIDHPAGLNSRELLPAKVVSDLGSATPPPAASISLGLIGAVEGDAVVVQRLPDTGGSVRARTAVPLRNLRDPVILLSLTDGTAVIVGQMYPSVPMEPAGGTGAEVLLKGERVIIDADVELLLKSGGCALRLDARGKTVLTADEIVSRARGVNKVQGGTVQLN